MKITSALILSAGLSVAFASHAAETLTIATVNNGDMIRMQRLSKIFEQQNPDIKLNWVVLEENVLRQRLTTDIATQGGQFDVLTIGTYETPLWGAKNWLEPMQNLPADYDVDDIFPAVRQGLSVNAYPLRVAVLWRKHGHLLPHRSVQGRGPDHAGKTDLVAIG